jgi:RimJ/RimL family protein N-acetyltransferase
MKKQIGKVIVRSAKINDIETLSNWWASGEVMAHAGFPNGMKTDNDQIKSDIISSESSKHPKFERLMISLEKGKDIGEMSYRLVKPYIYEIGIKICEFDSHNFGYGSKAIKALLDYLFKNSKAKKIVLNTNMENEGAQRFYERLGFNKIAVIENSWRNQLGLLQSSVEYAMTKENYSTLKE